VFVAGYLLNAIANLVNLVLTAYIWIIIARAVLSWVNPDPYNPLVRFLYRVTEPVLRPVRQWLPTYQIGLDLSPMVVLLGIYFLQQFLVPVLYRIASEMG
jgi:YggT family protein